MKPKQLLLNEIAINKSSQQKRANERNETEKINAFFQNFTAPFCQRKKTHMALKLFEFQEHTVIETFWKKLTRFEKTELLGKILIPLKI